MTIDFVLVCLQTLILGLYGMNGAVPTTGSKKVRWIAAYASFTGLLICFLFLETYIKNNIQILLLLLLLLNYLLHLGRSSLGEIVKITVFTSITFIAYASLYFQLSLSVPWLTIPFVLLTLVMCLNKWPDFLHSFQEYFLKVGTLLTLLIIAEPVALSIQKNLKPIATIPLSSVINQHNILLLSILLGLMLGGFFWKERIRS